MIKKRIIEKEYKNGKITYVIQVKFLCFWFDLNMYGEPAIPILSNNPKEYDSLNEARSILDEWNDSALSKTCIRKSVVADDDENSKDS